MRKKMGVVMGFEEFQQVHAVLLASAGVPASLHRLLFEKLSADVFDGGSFFRIEPCEDGVQQRRLILSCESMAKNSNVFLIDHAWSFRLSEARKQLQEIPGLVERMATLMCVVDETEDHCDTEDLENGEETSRTEERPSLEAAIETAQEKANEKGQTLQWLELDDQGITDADLQSTNLSAKCPDLVGLSLWGNPIESADAVVHTVAGISCMRALWLNDTPVNTHHGASLEQALLKVLPKLEIYNSKVTEKYGQWAIAFCAGILGVEQPMGSSNGNHMLSNVTTLDLSDRHLQVLLPNVFNADELPSLTSLNLRGNLFKDETPASLLRTLKSLVTLQSLQVDIPGPFGSAVSIAEALPNLYQLNGMSLSKILEGDKQFLTSDLKPRLHIWSPKEPLSEQVMSAMWQYVLTYRLADDEKLDETPIWYVMDELGSALRHSDNPNFQVAPFMFLPDGTLKSAISYTLMWPIEDVGKGNECMRDYLFGVGEDKQRSSRLTAWFHTPPELFKQAYEVHCNELKHVKLMKGIADGSPTQSIHPSDGRPLRVYSDIPAVTDLLSQPEFILVEDVLMADIIWTHLQIDDEFQNEVGLQRHQYVNQFPGETCFVMKHFLAQTVQKAYGSPAWMQPTYNMETQLPALIGDYLARQEKKQDNLWIVKPWNMARTIDTTVTGSLAALLRLVETGPKICQKYIEKPALYQGRKFDLRYIVLLRSIQPLEIFLSDVFWARFSNNQYTTDKNSLSEYDTHFTVMNYGGRPLNHINAHDWVPEFEKEHNVKWQDIHQRVRNVLRAVFEGAIATSPNMHSPTSRAIYGVDIMLDDSFQPKLLEVTYCPDCGRACNYDLKNILGDGELIRGSNFYNDVFSCLFLNECKHVCPL